ncbi:MAG: ABC transporter substrate-binding protein, partial [Xanthobacteraceae bacterium]
MNRLLRLRAIPVVLLVLAASMLAAPAMAQPRRVVSFNVCTDQLAVALADPAQIAGLSPYATDRTLSAVADAAQSFRRLAWHAESTIPLDPDLVLVGPRDRSVTQRLLTALGFRVVEVEFVSTIAAAREQI